MSVAHDWRLGPYTVDDLDDPVLRLVGTTYVRHATAGAAETLSISEPFPIQIDVAALRDQ